MPPKKIHAKSAVFEYFTITLDNKHYVCQCIVNDDDGERLCKTEISSFTGSVKNAPTRASNLKRHLQRFHPEIYSIVLDKDKSIPSSSTPSTSTVTQPPMSRFVITDKVTVTMTSAMFKNCIIRMVVKNSLPLLFFSQPAFTDMNGEMARKLGVSLKRESIRKLVVDEANNQKKKLQSNLKGRFIFLKMDGCTRHRVNYFAINVRFVDDNNKIVTRTLGLRDTKAHHTGEYLQKLVEKVLDDFEIKKEKILCIVTDNASNMISTIEKMNEFNIVREEILEVEVNEEEIINPIRDSQTEDENQELVPSIEFENNDIDNVVEEAAKLISIQHFRCGVHTLQLAIRDGLKNRHAATLIGKLRQVATSARTPKFDALLKRQLNKGAILDQATRWGSTYMMIKRLLELQTILENQVNESIFLTEYQWTQTKELERLLSLPFIVTKKFQAEDLTPGDFLMEYRTLIFELNKIGGPIAEGIVASMKKRESLLLKNKIFLGAVYLDPMNRILLNSEQITTGKEALYEIILRMKGLLHAPENPASQEVVEERVISGSHSPSSNEEGAEPLTYKAYLDKIERSKAKRRRLNITKTQSNLELEMIKFKKDFQSACDEVENYDRTSKMTIEEVMPIYPEIVRNAALVLTAMPPTQVSVERLFSALKIVKSDLRASIKEDLAEAILFLRTNLEDK